MRVVIARRARVAVLLTALVLTALELTGCMSGADSGPQPGMAKVWQPLTFRLGSVTLVDAADGIEADPDLIGAFSRPPHQVVRDWAVARLHGTPGQPGRLVVDVKEASAARTQLDTTPGVRGWFTRDQVERVTIRLAVHLEAQRNDGSLIASADARASSNRTFGQRLAPADRRAALDALLQQALVALDREMETQVRAQMADLVTP